MKKINTGLTITLVVTILLTIYLSIATILNLEVVQGYAPLAWMYLYLFVLLPAIVILFLLLTFKYATLAGLNALKNLRWNFVLLSILVIMFLLTGHLDKFFMFKDRVIISIKNQMHTSIEIARIYGRHDLVELNEIKEGEVKFIEFRGKPIDRKTINYLENRVHIDIYSNKEWNTLPLVDSWTEMTWDTLNVTIIKMDSITIN